jgi:hypothetical protein
MVRAEAWNPPGSGNSGALSGRRILSAFAGAASLFLATGTDAADDVLLKRFVGEWVGTGSFRYDSASGADPLWCRITGTVDGDGALIESGRCSLPDQAASFRAEIRPAGSGKYNGTASGVLGLAKAPAFTGTGKTNQLVFVAPTDDGPVTVVLDLVSGGFRMKAERADPKTGTKYSPIDVKFGPP